MARTNRINEQWEQFQKYIGIAYKAAATADEQSALHDYAPDISMRDGLADLLARETANERQHRRGNRRNPSDFSSQTASKLILMQKAADGSEMKDCPSALHFLIYRREAIEAEVIGWCCRSGYH